MNIKNNHTYIANDKAIKDSFLNLLNYKEIHQITVSSICNLAKINRSTFYAHYCDIYDLLSSIEKDMNSKIIAHQSPDNYAGFYESGEFIKQFLSFIKENQTFYKACLNSRTSFPINKGFDSLWNYVVKPLCLKNGVTSESKMMYYLVYYQAGFTMVLKHWVNSNCNDNIEDIEKLLKRCMNFII